MERLYESIKVPSHPNQLNAHFHPPAPTVDKGSNSSSSEMVLASTHSLIHSELDSRFMSAPRCNEYG